MDGIDLSIVASLKLIFTTACALAGATAPGLAQSSAILVPIESMVVGAAPADFDFARTGQGDPGKWAVVGDPTALGGRAIEQTSSEATDYRFPLAIYKPVSAGNVAVSVHFKATAGRVDQAGGVVVRLIDANNYYVARANALEDNVRFYRVVRGRREQIDGADVKVPAKTWHTLALRAEGNRFTVAFNGKDLFAAADRTIGGAGRVAIWTKADSVTRFDRIEIKTLP
jgi:glycosyl hydrolase family 59 (putative galactocerebrosidase)